MHITLLTDPALYESIARAFAAKSAEVIARAIAAHDGVPACPPSASAENRLFDVLFFGLAQFEEASGIELEGRLYFPHCLFSTVLQEPEVFIAGRGGALHGTVDDQTLKAALAEVCGPTATSPSPQDTGSESH